MSHQEQLRRQRLEAGITIDMVCVNSGGVVDRCRLSLAERGLVRLSPTQVQRISEVIEDLATKKRLIDDFAVGVGWPSPARI